MRRSSSVPCIRIGCAAEWLRGSTSTILGCAAEWLRLRDVDGVDG